jgi:Sporulation and spore germination
VTRRAAIVLLAVLAAGVGALLLLRAPQAQYRKRRAAAAPALRPPVHPGPPAAAGKARLTLYFPGRQDGLLRPEEREIDKPADAVAVVRAVVAELAAGPRQADLMPALPDKVSLRNAFVPEGGLVVVDLNVDPAWARAAGGEEEQTTVAALVDSLLQNVARAQRVRILVAGNPVETLAGHVDLTRPLPAFPEAIAPAQPPAAPEAEAPKTP